MIHIPILRHGVPYKSLDVIRIPHHRTRETFAEMSQVNPGIIRRDLRDEVQADARARLARLSFEELLDICRRAAGHFLNDTLPLGDAEQSPDDYVQQLSATTGMPHALVRKNMAKIAGVMTEMRTVLAGLTRGLDLSLLDAGHGEHAGHALSFYPRTQSLGVVPVREAAPAHEGREVRSDCDMSDVQQQDQKSSTGLDANVASALAYIPIVAIIFLVPAMIKWNEVLSFDES